MTGLEEHIGDWGVAVALIIGAVFIVRAVMSSAVQAAQLWNDASKVRAKADERIAESLETVAQNLKKLSDDTTSAQSMVDGMRREHTVIIGSLASNEHGLEAIARKIEGLPQRTAGAVRDELRMDLEQIRNAAASVTLSIDSLVTKINDIPAMDAAINNKAGEPERGAEAPEANDKSKQDGEQEKHA